MEWFPNKLQNRSTHSRSESFGRAIRETVLQFSSELIDQELGFDFTKFVFATRLKKLLLFPF